MTTVMEKKDIDFKIEIGTKEPKQWSEREITQLKDEAKKNAKKRTPEQRLKNELMTLQFEMEKYLTDNTSTPRRLTLEKVVSNYLGILNFPFRKFALHLDTTDGNLRKYLSGERKFNTDLAMKFGHFFHTSPELWLHLQLKNELSHLKREKKQVKHYEKYDYRKALGITKYR